MTPDKPSASEARELLPCPFCGGSDLVLDENSYKTKWVICDGCGAQIDDSPHGDCVDLWNTRAPQGGERELLKRLEWCLTKDSLTDNERVSDALIVIRRALAALPSPAATADQWQPIETAPKDGSKIDLFVTPPNGAIVGSYDGRVCDCWFSNNKWWLYDDSQYATDADNCRTEVWNVTHWMPRAAPPALTDKRPPMQEDGK